MLRTIPSARWAFAALALAIMLAAGCGGESADTAAEPMEKAPERSAEEVKADFEETMAAYGAIEDKEEQFKIWFAFLERNPNGDYTVGTLNYLANNYYNDHMGDPAGGVAFIEKQMKHLTDDRVDGAMDLLIQLNGKAGNVDKLQEIASGMEAEGKLDFQKHLTFANACVSAEDWEQAAKHAKAAYDGA
ncbi:MAG: hypothetical protein MI919_09760, partial [Holophagales bacterium]|nr:hypothetical protein [Holophagales bacterium]